MTNAEDLGRIQINDDVIATIAALAAVEVEGIVGTAGSSWFSGGKGAKRGITVTTDEQNNYAVIDCEVNVQYGVDVYQVATNLQRTVKNAVEGMTGLRVKAVNVKIVDIVLGDQSARRAVAPPSAAAAALEEPAERS